VWEFPIYVFVDLRLVLIHSGAMMQFILGVVLFVVVIGWLDAGLPWPRCNQGTEKE